MLHIATKRSNLFGGRMFRKRKAIRAYQAPTRECGTLSHRAGIFTIYQHAFETFKTGGFIPRKFDFKRTNQVDRQSETTNEVSLRASNVTHLKQGKVEKHAVEIAWRASSTMATSPHRGSTTTSDVCIRTVTTGIESTQSCQVRLRRLL